MMPDGRGSTGQVSSARQLKDTVMRKFLLPLAAALSLTATSFVTAYCYAEEAMSQTAEIGALKITGAWAKAMLPGQPVGGGYLKIENKGAAPDRLVSATSPSSPDVEIHEMRMEGDVMKMRELPDGLEIPADGAVELKPGGLHLMFMAVPTPLKEGDLVKVVLKFEKAGEVEVTLPVSAANAAGPGHAHGG
jgi:periplasmic copper chaperone A